MAAKKPLEAKKPTVKEIDGGKEVTIDGLKIVLQNAAFRDHRVTRQLAKLRSDGLPMEEKVILNGEMIDRVLGEAQANKLIDALADENGYTDVMVLTKKFGEIVGAAFPNS